MATALTTLTVKQGSAVATVSVKRMTDGSIVFTDKDGHVVQAHSNPELTALFLTLAALA